MAFHPIALTTEVHVRYSINSIECENVLHYKWNNTTPPTAAELLTLATEVYQTVAFRISILAHVGFIMREVYARNMDVSAANQATYIQSPQYTGQRLGTKVPNQVAKSLEKRTGLTGRSNHGGMRLSGFVISDIDRDYLLSGLLTLITNLALSVIAARVGGRFVPAVGSRTLGTSRIMSSLHLPTGIVGSTDTRTATS